MEIFSDFNVIYYSILVLLSNIKTDKYWLENNLFVILVHRSFLKNVKQFPCKHKNFSAEYNRIIGL